MASLHKSNSARNSFSRTPLVSALLCAGLLGMAPAYAATITVDSIADTTGNPAICTLRDAITAADTNAAVGGCVAGVAGQDTINFSIPGAGVHTIVLTSVLPTIDEPLIVNGYTQPGAAPNSIAHAYPAGAAINAQPMIEIDGNGLAGNGLFYVAPTANGSVVTGLSVGNFLGAGAFLLLGQANINGNFIGVRADGTTAFPNMYDINILSTSHGSNIGTTVSPARRNLIGGKVHIDGATNVTISGNLMGTDKSGTTVVGTLAGGGQMHVELTTGPTIISNNVVNYGSQQPGIWIAGASNTAVSNNLIGVGVGGVALGNDIGILLENKGGAASNNVIQANTIANSVSSGIQLVEKPKGGGVSGNRLDFNSIYGNGGLGIDLFNMTPVWVLPNDAGDSDIGSNAQQNFPVITSSQVNAGGGVDIAFTLNSTPNGLFSITAYANPVCNASGYGEGRYDSGTAMNASTDASGNFSGTYTVPAPLPAGWSVGQVVALLARDTATNDTSEFSACATAAAFAVNQPPVVANDSYSTPFNTALNVPAAGVLVNDSDPDGNPITAVLAVGPSHGTLTLNANGSFSYTPGAGYSGQDSFTYYANDGTVSSVSAATVSITVGAAANQPPVAANDSYATPFNTALNIAASGVLANDSDPDGNAITAVLNAGPGNGTLTLNANGGFVYTPTAGYSGPDSFSYYAFDGTVNNSSAATVNITVGSAVPPPPPPPPDVTIPGLDIPPSCDINAVLPPIVNLSLNEGPAFAADMVAILSNAVGQTLVFLEQDACGTVTLSGFKGGKLAFIPHTFQTGDARANGIYPMGNGQYQVVRNGQSLVIAPALVHVEQITALLPGVAAKQADNGVMTATVNGLTYVVQASAAVQLDVATGAAQLLLGSDGLFHFIDALGHNQVLNPAFADPATLRSVLLGLDPNATLNIELDGTATVVLNGQHFTLVPDLTLSAIPAERAGQTWWQESATRYWVANLQILGTSQGVTVKP